MVCGSNVVCAPRIIGEKQSAIRLEAGRGAGFSGERRGGPATFAFLPGKPAGEAAGASDNPFNPWFHLHRM
jgi:hypothetical protein